MPKTINDRLNQTAMLASMTHAAKAGIIAKSGRHMERLAD
jgi:cation transport ATPase